jgi:hypothetical protein
MGVFAAAQTRPPTFPRRTGDVAFAGTFPERLLSVSFRVGDFMKSLLAPAAGTAVLAAADFAMAQNSNMMNDGGWGMGWMGGYGGAWGPILLVVVIAVVVVLVMQRRGK